MHSNDTSTIITTTTIPATSATSRTGSVSRPVSRPRLRALAGGVVAIGGVTFGIGAALAQESTVQVNPAVADHPAIAEMARSNGLTGLSPASLAPTAVSNWYGNDAAIADWARANGLTGLSPASLAPVDD